MLFVLLFICSVLIVPLILDARNHGSDNIFRRSGRDVLGYQPVQAAFRLVHVSASNVSTAVMGFAGMVAVLLVLGVSLQLLKVAGQVVSRIIH